MRRIFFLLYLASISSLSFGQSVSPKIINGIPGSTKDYPWVVNFSGCGGSLIAPQWILTAAHCFNTDDNKSVNTQVSNREPVTLLTDNIIDPAPTAQKIAISEIIVHPDYNPTKGYNNDIALMKLANPVVNPSPVVLMGDKEVPSNSTITVMGWGTTAIDADNKSTNPSPILLKTQQIPFSQASCQQIYGQDSTQITDNMLCLNGLEGQANTDTCQGDSGGPAVTPINNTLVQIGVVSFGGLSNTAPCGDPKVPGVYARIANYQSWIKNLVPEANFYTSNTNENCGTVSDPNLNFKFNCVIYQGNVYQTNFWSIKPLVWQWEGQIQASNCPNNLQNCASVSDNLSVQIPKITIDGQSYQAVLRFAPEQGTNLWTYQSHKLNP